MESASIMDRPEITECPSLTVSPKYSLGLRALSRLGILNPGFGITFIYLSFGEACASCRLSIATKKR
jgi:hypothetical protein